MLLFSCALAPPPRPEPLNVKNSVILDRSYEETWTQLVEYFASRMLTIKTIDKDSGFLDSDYMGLDINNLTDYVWTGDRLPNAIQYTGRIKANIFVKRLSSQKTSVTINVFCQVYQQPVPSLGSPEQYINAKSTGKFESEIITYLTN